MPYEPPKVLFVDDDEIFCRSNIASIRRRWDTFQPLSAHTQASALALAEEHAPRVAVLDLAIIPAEGPQSGLRLLGQLLALIPYLRVVILTGHGEDRYGIDALRAGAVTFLCKPPDTDHLTALIKDNLEQSRLQQLMLMNGSSDADEYSIGTLRTRSSLMRIALETVEFAASTNQAVLLVGETGVGKGVFAQAIHSLSKRRKAPLVRFQPLFGGHDLVGSQLFGHERGAFTGANDRRIGLIEDAHGGTLFIDEVDELPVETQIMLLNTLQEKSFRRLGGNKELSSDFRLVAATNRSVEESLRSGKLRHDFYHRLAHVTITIPPLRERTGDLPDLATQFLRAIDAKEQLGVFGFEDATLLAIRSHPWTGNVRELQATIEGAAYRARFAKRGRIQADDLGLTREVKVDENPGSQWSLRTLVEAYEQKLVDETMDRVGGNISQASRELQIDRKGIRRILDRKKSS